MKQLKSISLKEILKWGAVVFLALIIGMGALKRIKGNPAVVAEDVKTEEVFVKSVETIPYGSWEPGVKREVLGTVESVGDIELVAELSGTIENVFVEIGESVSRGQVLARYRRGDDQTFVNYQNAVSSLEQSKLSAENGVKQSEIALQTAKQELQEQRGLQGQTKSQQFENLKVETRNSDTVIENAINYIDRVVRGTNRFQTDSTFGASQIGKNDTISRQNLKNRVIAYDQERASLSQSFISDIDITNSAEQRSGVLQNLQVSLDQLDSLVRNTPLTGGFLESTRVTFEQQVEAQRNGVNQQRASLIRQIEQVKSQSNQSGLGLLQAENRVKTAEANLELAKSNAKGSILASENGLSSAAISLSDLDVRAPFNGIITAKNVNSFQQMSPGTPMFSIENKGVEPKVVAFVTQDELKQLLASDNVSVRIDEDVIQVNNGAVSTKVDIATQKVKVEYDLPKGENKVYVGSLARLILPSSGNESGSLLLPLSAVGFEPDGPEVLIIRDGVATRQKVTIGDVRSDGAEITLGINTGDEVVRYRSRVYAGEKVKAEESNTTQ